MRIVFLTRHEGLGASSRYRSLQYFDALRAAGHQVEQRHFYSDTYLRQRYAGRMPLFEAAKAYARRARALVSLAAYADAIVIEKETFPFLPSVTERPLLRGKAAVLYDYDDAIWHSYETRKLGPLKGKIARVVAQADHVIVGSHYLKDYVEASGARGVSLIPTTVPARRYNGAGVSTPKNVDLVWIGSMSTGPHVEAIFPVIERLHRERGARIRLIGFPTARLGKAPPAFTEIKPWSQETELSNMASARIGVMPLPDNPFERGKCGFKLVQYMGLGLPVIASPVGENRHIVDHGETGFLAQSPEEWRVFIERLLDDRALATGMGVKGRQKYLRHYSAEAAAVRLEGVITRTVKAKCVADGARSVSASYPNPKTP